MIYGSVCSGIEAASVGWHPLGWRAAFVSEIDAAPRAVLRHHFPDVPLHGDFTTIKAGQYDAIDLLVGGTPCQDFSVAGLRGGLDAERGGLTLEFARLAYRLRPRWMVWENVPGVFSSNEGRDFGAVLACFAGHPAGYVFEPPAGGWCNAGIVEPAGREGYGLAWRVLDAQYVRVDGHRRAVPQRRRRVFVVGCVGDWRRAAAVLFERQGMSRDPAPRRKAGQGAAVGALGGTGPGGGWRLGADEAAAGQLVSAPFAPAINASNPYGDHESREGLLVAHSLRAAGFDASEDGTGRGTPIVPVAFGGNDTRGPIEVATAVNAHGGPHGRLDFESETFVAAPTAATLTRGAESAGRGGYAGRRQEDDVNLIALDTTQITSATNRCRPEAVAFQPRYARNGRGAPDTVASALTAEPGRTSKGDSAQCVAAIGHNRGPPMWTVRRLTPTECERLQGFPDGWTLVPGPGGKLLADGPRYKMLGNSMAVNCMHWIGWRIAAVERISA